MKLLLLGDTHGENDVIDNVYRNFLKDGTFDKIIHLGDLGFSDDWDYISKTFPPDKFQVIKGNHDDYDWISQNKPPHDLGDFGLLPGTQTVFFVRGAYSIDKDPYFNKKGKLVSKGRTPGLDWWEQEELSNQQMEDCINLYSLMKPKIVLSHSCPQSVSDTLFTKKIATKTGQFMDALHEIHEPDNWYFGHYHSSFIYKKGNTLFKCLNINEILGITVI